MNTIFEQINSAGGAFVEFALPMLIQSGLLIVVLLLADFLLRKKVKAVFRYWIWMLVLAKLVLPTSLSSPLSLGYWIGDHLAYLAESQPATMPEAVEPALADISPVIDLIHIQPNAYIPPTVPITSVVEPVVAGPVGPPAAPVTPLSWQGVVFLIWLAVVIAMALLLLQRALFVRGLVAQAKEANRLMNDALGYCCERMGVKGKVGLKVSTNATSPAVCGLIRPMILLPRNLAPGLGASHLRAVLLHELAHIKRGDLWVNLAQTVLQIVYFYNPLLWLANAIIRRVREQAVDEAVLVAMGAKARQYPQTLVDVARLAFKRPTLSLRLIGVVESESALAGRIKHILGRPIPKSTKLGILSALAIIIIGAILLPMAKAAYYTDHARQIMKLAKQEARQLNHEYVGTEHILLALVKEGRGVSGIVLRRLGVNAENVRLEVQQLVKSGSEVVATKKLPKTPRVKRAMEYAKEEAKVLGHDYVGAEHVLLGLLREKDAIAGQVLMKLGLGLDVVRQEVLDVVGPKPRRSGYPTLVITGVVTDAATGEPIAGARVGDDGYGPKPYRGAVTDSDGRYYYLTWPEHHGIKAQAAGYKGQRKSLYDGHFTFGKEMVEEVFDFALEDVAEASKFKATLSNGVTVELVGLFRGKTKETLTWWRLDGNEITKGEFASYRRKIQDKWIRDTDFWKFEYGYALKLTPSEDVSVRTSATVGQTMHNSPATEGKCVAIVESDDQQRQKGLSNVGDVKVSVAYGVWKGFRQRTRPTDSDIYFMKDGSKLMVTALKPSTDDPLHMSSIDVIDNSPRTIEIRVMYELKNGQVCKAWERGRMGGRQSITRRKKQLTPMVLSSFDLPHSKENIKSIWLEYRLYQRVTFKNISLRTGVKTDVELEVEEAGKASIGVIDVAVEDFKIRPYGAGGLYVVTVAIQNNSNVTAPAFRLNFYRGDPAHNLNLHGKPQTGSHGAGPIKPGDVWNEGSMSFALKEGINEIAVVLDPDNKIAESDETNNRASMKVIVKDGRFIERTVSYSSQKNVESSGVKTDVQIEGAGGKTAKSYRKRYFATLVVTDDGVVFKGQKLTWERVQEKLKTVPDRQITALEVAVDSAIVPDNLRGSAMLKWVSQSAGFQKAAQLQQDLGFEYLSNVGVDRVSSRRGPVSVRFEDALRFGEQIPVALMSFEEQPLLRTTSIEFEKAGADIRAVLKAAVTSYPKKSWEIGVRLLDAQGRQITSVVETFENSGVARGYPVHTKEEMNFSFGQAADLANAKRFEVKLRQFTKKLAAGRTDVHVGFEETISPKLVMLLGAINSCGAETELNIESISITARNISIRGDTSGRPNTQKFLDAIRKNELKILQLRLDARDNRDKFSIIVDPEKDWQQRWRLHKNDVQLGVEETISPKLVMLLGAINSCAAETKLNIESISIKAGEVNIKGDTSSRINSQKFLDSIKKNELEVLRLNLDARNNRDKFSIVVEPKKNWQQWWQQHKTNVQVEAARAKKTASQQLSFGPVTERVLSFNFFKDSAYLDLDTGRYGKEQPGRDLIAAAGESDMRVRAGLDMVAIPVEARRWESSPQEVLGEVAKGKPQRQVRLGGPESRRTFFFKTREGSVGVLQILPLQDSSGQVKVRYKLVQGRQDVRETESRNITRHQGLFGINKEIPANLGCPVVKDVWGRDQRPFKVETVEFVKKDERLHCSVKIDGATTADGKFIVWVNIRGKESRDSAREVLLAVREFLFETICFSADRPLVIGEVQDLDFGSIHKFEMATSCEVVIEDITQRVVAARHRVNVTTFRGTFKKGEPIPVKLDCPAVKDPLGNFQKPFKVETVEFAKKDDHLYCSVKIDGATAADGKFIVWVKIYDREPRDSASGEGFVDPKGFLFQTHCVIADSPELIREVQVLDFGPIFEDVTSFEVEIVDITRKAESAEESSETDVHDEVVEATETRSGSELEFRIAPEHVLSSRAPSPLTIEEMDRYKRDLAQNGPLASRARDGEFAWFQIRSGANVNSLLVNGEYQGEKYLLLHNREPFVMLPRQGWRLVKAAPIKNAAGRPNIQFELDEKGAELFSGLTEANRGRALAIVIDGKVVSAPTVRAAIRNKGIIIGNFTEEEVEEMAASLRKGMPAREKSDPALDVEFAAGAFEELSVKFGGIWMHWQDVEFTVRGDGSIRFSMNKGPKDKARYKTAFKLSGAHLAELSGLLQKTNWLTAPGANVQPRYSDAARIDIKLVREGKTNEVWCHDRNAEPYLSLIIFLKRIHRQEYLLYQMTVPGAANRNSAFSDVYQQIRAEKGEPVSAHPHRILDFSRFIRPSVELIGHPDENHYETVAIAARILGKLKVEQVRPQITDLTTAERKEHHTAAAVIRTAHIREAAVEALTELGGEQARMHVRDMAKNYRSWRRQVNEALVEGLLKLDRDNCVQLLKDMASTTKRASWGLIRLRPAALPVIVEVLKVRDIRYMGQIYLIRQYIDHWKEVPKPIDPRVVEAVQKNLDYRLGRGPGWTNYHKEFLQLAGAPELPSKDARQIAEEFLAAVKTNDQMKIGAIARIGGGNWPQRLAKLKSLPGLQQFEITEVYADTNDNIAWAIAAATGPDNENSTRARIILNFLSGSVWRVFNIAIERPEIAERMRKRYLESHPNAKPVPAKSPSDPNFKTDVQVERKKVKAVIDDFWAAIDSGDFDKVRQVSQVELLVNQDILQKTLIDCNKERKSLLSRGIDTTNVYEVRIEENEAVAVAPANKDRFQWYYLQKNSTGWVIKLFDDAPPSLSMEDIFFKCRSIPKLTVLGAALRLHAAEHNSQCPDTLKALEPYIPHGEIYQWLNDNIEYLGAGKKMQTGGSPDSIIAYTKTLLSKDENLSVLYNDASVSFELTKKFKQLKTDVRVESEMTGAEAGTEDRIRAVIDQFWAAVEADDFGRVRQLSQIDMLEKRGALEETLRRFNKERKQLLSRGIDISTIMNVYIRGDEAVAVGKVNKGRIMWYYLEKGPDRWLIKLFDDAPRERTIEEIFTESRGRTAKTDVEVGGTGQKEPKITFEKGVYDFGEVGPKSSNSCEFRFTNNGSALLKITKVRSTCGCTTSKLKKKEYAPGERGTLEITYQSPASTGRVTKHVYVYSDDKVNPEVKLTVKAEIAVKVAHKPEKLNLLLDKKNAGGPAITLTSLDNQPFSITGFKSTGDSITADFDPSVKDMSFVIHPKVDMEKLRKGLRGNIEISLNHPECKAVSIIFHTLAEFKVEPRVVYVRDAEPQKPVTKKVSLLSNYNKDFEVESTSSRKGNVKVLAQKKVRNGYQFELQITPTAVESKRRVFTDEFSVKIKGGQELKVTCYGIYSKKPAGTPEESVHKTDVKFEVEQSGEASETATTELTVPGPVKTRGGISGTVVNSLTGEPVAGAYVGVGDFGDSGGSNYSRHRSQGFHDKTKTDEQGRFEIDGLAFTDDHPYLKYHPLVVTHPDFVRHDEEIELLKDKPIPDVKVSLRPAAKIDVTVVDADGNPLKGHWLLRLEALDGRRFIPPGSDPHLSSFASSIWAHWPDLRRNMGTSEGFSFMELDTGQYSIEAIRFHLVDKPTPQNIWKPTITYHGSIPSIEIQAGQAKQVQLPPQDHQTRLTITPPEFPEMLLGKLKRSSRMPLMCLVSRSPELLLWDDVKIYHLEDQRLGRIDKKRFFRGFFLQGEPLTINNLPPASYSLFTMAVYGDVAGCLIGARADLAKGDNVAVEIPWRQPTGPSVVGPNRAFDYPVKLEDRDYSVSELCELLTDITKSNPRIIADSSIENEKLRFGEDEIPIWDVLEKLYLDKGWRVDEGADKTLIIRPGVKTDVQVELEKAGKNLYTSKTWQAAFYEAERIIRTRQTWPETPEALAKAFWKTRALKDYKEMEILWPGSGSWNWAEICKNDPAVNYVFGKARKDNPNVPYASEEYFAENQSYNLTMCISGLSTKKGKRYYITSGN